MHVRAGITNVLYLCLPYARTRVDEVLMYPYVCMLYTYIMFTYVCSEYMFYTYVTCVIYLRGCTAHLPIRMHAVYNIIFTYASSAYMYYIYITCI